MLSPEAAARHNEATASHRVRGCLVPSLPRIKLSAAAFQGSKKKEGGQKGKVLFSCLFLHLHKVKNVSIETTRLCNF